MWEICDAQTEAMLDCYAEVAAKLDLDMIAQIDFSWIHATSIRGRQEVRDRKDRPIPVVFSRRNPSAKLAPQFADCLLVAM